MPNGKQKLYRLVHDPCPIHLEGHHYTISQIVRCSKQGVFLDGTVFREGKNLWCLAGGKLLSIGHTDLPRGVNQRLRQSRLSPEEVGLIRRRIMAGESKSAIAREFKISVTYVYKIDEGTRR